MEKGGIVFDFRGLLFDRLKFSRSNKYTDEFFEDLIKEGSHCSKIKYKDAIEYQLDENIHIYLSYSLVLKVLSMFTLVFTLITSIKSFFLISFIIFIASILIYLGFNYCKRRANEVFAGKDTCIDLVNLVFDIK